jgi:hypothetical protein
MSLLRLVVNVVLLPSIVMNLCIRSLGYMKHMIHGINTLILELTPGRSQSGKAAANTSLTAIQATSCKSTFVTLSCHKIRAKQQSLRHPVQQQALNRYRQVKYARKTNLPLTGN